jgi:small nuclear ribonucleoprotein (snRNP)-like protein
MLNRRRRFTALVLVGALLLSAVTVAAQDQKNDWSKVTAIATGTKLAVKLRTGKTLNGTLNSASDSGLTLTVKNATKDVKRDEVASVHEVLNKNSATKAALIGTGIGAGVGAATGAIGDANDDAGFDQIDHVATAALTVVGAGVGALVGYFIGRSGNKRVLVYEAK